MSKYMKAGNECLRLNLKNHIFENSRNLLKMKFWRDRLSILTQKISLHRWIRHHLILSKWLSYDKTPIMVLDRLMAFLSQFRNESGIPRLSSIFLKKYTMISMLLFQKMAISLDGHSRGSSSSTQHSLWGLDNRCLMWENDGKLLRMRLFKYYPRNETFSYSSYGEVMHRKRSNS